MVKDTWNKESGRLKKDMVHENNKKTIGIVLAGVLIFFFVLIVYSIARSPGETVPEYVFLYAENQTSDYPTTLGALEFARLVEERTNGKIRILVKAEGELGTEGEVIQQMQFGGIDYARVSISQLAETIPDMNVLQLPYLYKDSAHMWRVLDGEIGDDFLEISQEYDLIGLSWYDAGARNFYNSKRPITRLEDMQGMHIRVQGSQMMADMVQSLGAIAIKMDYDEVYSNLQKGVVDGAENNLPSYEAMLHYEVAGYYTNDEHTRVPEIQLCAKNTWDKLSWEYQEIIRQCAKESAEYERELWKAREEKSKQIAIDKGVQIIELSEEEKQRFRNAVSELYKTYCGDYMDIVNEILALQ